MKLMQYLGAGLVAAFGARFDAAFGAGFEGPDRFGGKVQAHRLIEKLGGFGGGKAQVSRAQFS